MAGQLAKRGGRRGRKRQQFSDINVTPFVDVMLVLLIVFMVSAPLMTTGVAVDLPNSQAKAITEENNAPLEVTLDGEGKVFVGETEVGNEKLIPFLTEVIGQKDDQRIYIRADETLPYSTVMAVLGAINRAGFSKVALISKPAGQ
jgi:biopolymer transport protein TolR